MRKKRKHCGPRYNSTAPVGCLITNVLTMYSHSYFQMAVDDANRQMLDDLKAEEKAREEV